MKAAEDFLEVVLFAHVITAAEQVMKTRNIQIDCEVVADSIINNFVTVSIPTIDEPASNSDTDEPAANSDTDEPASNSDTLCSSNKDFIYAYATDYLTMALLWHGFHDAIKMGDGNRIMSYWKFLTAIFQQTGHCNYAKQGFFMLAQSELLSSRRSTWFRTVNNCHQTTPSRAGSSNWSLGGPFYVTITWHWLNQKAVLGSGGMPPQEIY